MASGKPTVFVREATGLVREVGAWSSFMAVFFLVTGGVVVLELGTMYTAPGANWPVALFVAFLPSLLAGGMFTMIGSSLPRAGADYVFTTRATKSIIGFVNYWGLNIAFILNIGIFAYYGSSYLGYFLSGWGAYYNNASIANQGAYLVGPVPTFVIAILIILIFGAISVARPKNVWRMIFWVGVIALVTTVLMFVAMAGITSDSFQAAFNSFMGNSTAYSSVIQQGGISMPPPSFAATAAALPFAWFAYTWYNLSLGWTGEMKNVKRSLPITIIVALVAIAIYYILFSVLVVNAFGQSFLNNWSSLAYSGTTPVAGVGNFVPFFIFVADKAPWLYVAAFLALWIPTVFEFPAVIISQTRYLFAWAFDRILPDRFASVSDRFHTPIFATVLVLIGGIIGSGLMAVLPNPAEFAVVTFSIFSFGFIIPALAAIVFPYVRKDMFEANFSTKKFGLPLLSWLGLGTAVYLIYSTYLAHASGSLPLDNYALGVFGTVYGLGVIIYVVSYFWNKRRGLPLSLVFKEIPPE
ncbi:MAG TPA: APC family permease [Nitrososphaerales archaeon]|nr:APC family permease [Nitrososphaerales archaeon]